MSRPKNQTDGDGRLVEAFRQERLDHLRKSIDEGTYHVNDRNVAAAMVRRGVADVIVRAKSRVWGSTRDRARCCPRAAPARPAPAADGRTTAGGRARRRGGA